MSESNEQMTGPDAESELVRMVWPRLYGEVPETVADVLAAAHARLSRSPAIVYRALLQVAEEMEGLSDRVEAEEEAAVHRLNTLALVSLSIRAVFVATTTAEAVNLLGEARERAEMFAT